MVVSKFMKLRRRISIMQNIAAQIVQRNWWIMALRGLFAVIFGLIALLAPRIALLALIYVFAAYALVDGGVAVITAIQERDLLYRWGWVLFEGILSILVGIIAFANPALTAQALLYIIAVWAILTGVMEIAAAFAIREVVSREWVLALAGILSVAFGILLFIYPSAGILSILWLVGIYAIVFGILFIVYAFRLRSWASSVTA
jgi:uncharacterized membrane protein HdeD (DUF308 family)